MYLEDLITKKWKLDAENNRGKLYCLMPEFNDHSYLHELCKKLDMKMYDNFEKSFGIKLLPELKEFYKEYNGCRLFLSSINIFGLGYKESFPLDFAINDLNAHSDYDFTEEESKDIVIFGSVGDLDLFYKQSELNNPKIYLTAKRNKKPIQIFDTIKSMFEYYFKILYQEYNNEGYRQHPISQFIKLNLPFYANKFSGCIDWDIDETITKEDA